MRKQKIGFNEFINETNIFTICQDTKLDDLEDIYLNIGNGKFTGNGIINIINKQDDDVTPKIVKIADKDIDADIIVSGIDKVKVNLANCCNPVFGDPIVGYISKGNGIKVHRLHCHNLEMLEDRTLDVKWNTNINKRYMTSLLIHTNDSNNHMLDLIKLISSINVNVDGIKTMGKAEKIIYEVECYVTGLEQLNKLILSINNYEYVEKVERTMR